MSTQLTSEAFRLRLYVAGSSPRSERAVAAVSRLCKEYLRGRVDLEVIDIYQHKEAAREAQIIGVPTLDKELPPPLRRLIGDLSDERRLLLSLELDDLTVQDGGQGGTSGDSVV